ncbi:MAG: Up-regulated during septation-domain-containing protein [Benjaminiella poitrasii]|nr:MAG: Up-regulated during septation-domain-containing protein [Benjaminiella poitrasii]
MIPIIPRESTDDDRPIGLKFTRNNFFNFTKKKEESHSPSVLNNKEQPTPVLSPTLPPRSPYRVRSTQQQPTTAITTTIEDELENIWKFKSNHHMTMPVDQQQPQFDINSEDMILQLLISQALIDACDYKTLTFEEFELLKQRQVRLKTHVKNTTQKLEIDKTIQETSKSLLNLSNNNKNRESVLLLLDEAVEADRKVKILSQRLDELRSEDIETEFQILQHTAGVLCLGLQKFEQTEQRHSIHPISSSSLHKITDTEEDKKKKVQELQSELHTITSTLQRILKRYDMISILKKTSSPTEWLDYLDRQLANNLQHIQKTTETLASTNEASKNLEREIQEGHSQVAELKTIVKTMESETESIRSQAALFQAREDELKREIEQYRDQVLNLRVEEEKARQQYLENIATKTSSHPEQQGNNDDEDIKKYYEQQLEEQELEYQAQLKEQAAFLDKVSQQCERWQEEHDKLSETCKDLDLLIRDKQRALDARDVQINRLEAELKERQSSEQGVYPYQNEEITSLQSSFLEREASWIEQSAAMEANYEGILKEFDRLTDTAMEFEKDKINYEQRIENLTHEVKLLRAQLLEEKTRNLGCESDTPTTASLRKEFTKMINDMKVDHQRALEKEAEQKRRLEKQLKNLKHERDMSRYERINKGIQTMFIAS